MLTGVCHPTHTDRGGRGPGRLAGGAVWRGAVHGVSAAAADQVGAGAADDLPAAASAPAQPCHAHAACPRATAATSAAASPSAAAGAAVVAVGHAVRGHHRGHLRHRRAALRVEVAAAAVLAVELRLCVRVRAAAGEETRKT